MSMTHIILSNSGGELDRISLSDDDATTEAIAHAAIDLISASYSLHAGDFITVVED